jgi:hypothetical protein
MSKIYIVIHIYNSIFFAIIFQEKHVKEKQIVHLKEIIGIQEKLKANQNRSVKIISNILFEFISGSIFVVENISSIIFVRTVVSEQFDEFSFFDQEGLPVCKQLPEVNKILAM